MSGTFLRDVMARDRRGKVREGFEPVRGKREQRR
jgi:hypothetical protein